MFQVMKKNMKLIIIIITIVCIFGWGSSYAATTYAINSSNVEYKDNSSLGVTNVQAAIDGTCTKFNTQLTSLKADIVDTIYPVGSIYVSETDSTVTAVQNRFKAFGKTTTWVAYGSGKTLVGSGIGTDANGTTQTFSVSNNSKNLGEYTHQLNVSEMPNHNHGGATGTSKVSISTQFGYNLATNNTIYLAMAANNTINGELNTIWDSTNHYHSISSQGNSDFHNNISPYITVYMYKRTA